MFSKWSHFKCSGGTCYLKAIGNEVFSKMKGRFHFTRQVMALSPKFICLFFFLYFVLNIIDTGHIQGLLLWPQMLYTTQFLGMSFTETNV